MQESSRVKFDDYLVSTAKLNTVSSATRKFTVLPSIQQNLEKRLQESSEFLKLINVVPVKEMEGEKIGLGVSGTIAGRTNTSANPRVPRDVSSLTSNKYKCEKTNFDTALGYAKIDMWAMFPNFQELLRDSVLNQQALDRIMIGFNGESVAATTDRDANPLLEDVNIGWIKKQKIEAPARVMSEVVAASGVVNVGPSGDYENLDACVMDAATLLDPVAKKKGQIVAMVSETLLSDKYLPMVNRQQTAENELATDVIIAQRRLGGLPAVVVPYIPEGTVIITSFKNLSIYWQLGGRRRAIIDNPARDQIENFESSNDSYVIEDNAAMAVVENIVLGDFTTP